MTNSVKINTTIADRIKDKCDIAMDEISKAKNQKIPKLNRKKVNMYNHSSKRDEYAQKQSALMKKILKKKGSDKKPVKT